MIRSIVFDLDDTLIETTDCLAPTANREAARALVDGGLDQEYEIVVRRRWQAVRRMHADDVDDWVCRQFGESRPHVSAAGRRAYFERGSRLKRSSLRLVPGARKTLRQLAREYVLFLVTWGDPATQHRKIRLLRLETWFDDVVIVDRQARDGKAAAIRTLLQRHRLRSRDTLVVGDGWTQEIAAGNRLHARTCWISRGLPVPRWPPLRPDAVVKTVEELERVLDRLNASPP